MTFEEYEKNERYRDDIFFFCEKQKQKAFYAALKLDLISQVDFIFEVSRC